MSQCASEEEDLLEEFEWWEVDFWDIMEGHSEALSLDRVYNEYMKYRSVPLCTKFGKSISTLFLTPFRPFSHAPALSPPTHKNTNTSTAQLKSETECSGAYCKKSVDMSFVPL